MRGGLFRSTLTLLVGGAVAQVLPLLLGPWLARIYSPSEFGQFSTLWAFASNLAVVGCARYEFAIPLEEDDSAAGLLMALCARVMVTVTAVSAVVGMVLMQWSGLALGWLLPLAVLAGAATQWLTLWVSRAQLFELLAVARVLQYGGGALLQLVLGLLSLGVLGLFLGPVLAGLGVAFLLARPAPVGGWSSLWRAKSSALKAMAWRHRDFPLFNTPHAFANALQDSLALMLIVTWCGNDAAGYWALALRYLKAPAGLVGGALSQVLYPRLVRARSPAEAQHALRQSLAALLLLALPLLLGLLFLGPWLFSLVFGERWLNAGELARALSPYIAFHFIASPLSVCMLAWKAQAWGLRLALAGQVLFVSGLAAGLYLDGLMGAAWGVSAAMVAYFSYFFWALVHWKDFPYDSDQSIA